MAKILATTVVKGAAAKAFVLHRRGGSAIITPLLGAVCATAATVLSWVFLFVSVYAVVVVLARVIAGEPDAGLIRGIGAAMGTVLLPGYLLFFAGASVSLVVRRFPVPPVAFSVAVGALATLLSVPIHRYVFPPLSFWETLAHLALATFGAICGAALGIRGLSGQRATAAAISELAEAREPSDVAQAFAAHLAGPGAMGTFVWGREPEGLATRLDEDLAANPLVLLGGSGTGPPPLPRRLDATRVPRLTEASVEKLPADASATTYLIALTKPSSDDIVGIVAIVYASNSPAQPSGAMRTAWRSVASIAGLALENMRMIDFQRQAARARERNRWAGELHDTLTQGFVAIIGHLSGIPKADVADAEHRRDVLRARLIAQENLRQARRMIWDSGPEGDRHEPIEDAMRTMVEEWCERTELSARFDSHGAPLPVSPQARHALCRVAEEALTNVARHAGARHVRLTLTYLEDAALLDVRDDGAGFDLVRRPKGGDGGFGILNMRRRVEDLGGDLEVISEAGGGTIVSAEVPLKAKERP